MLCHAHLLTHVRVIFPVNNSGITNVSVAVVPSLSVILGHHCVTISAVAGLDHYTMCHHGVVMMSPMSVSPVSVPSPPVSQRVSARRKAVSQNWQPRLPHNFESTQRRPLLYRENILLNLTRKEKLLRNFSKRSGTIWNTLTFPALNFSLEIFCLLFGRFH